MAFNRRTFSSIGIGVVAGGIGEELRCLWWSVVKNILSALTSVPTIEKIVHGRVDNVQLPTLDESVDSISTGLPGARRDMIYAIVKQERPTGQSDFFIGEEYWIDQHKPTILFERHVFYRCLERHGQRNNVPHLAQTLLKNFPGHEGILNKTITPQGQYGSSSTQYNRLREAFDLGRKYPEAQKIIEDCALMACSWWLAQMLGENYEQLWYKSVRDFVINSSNPKTNAENFIRYAKSTRLYDRLRDTHFTDDDIRKIAQIQNGYGVRPEYIEHLKLYMRERNMYVPGQDLIYPIAVGIGSVAIANKIKGPKKKKKKRAKLSKRDLLKYFSGAVGAIVVNHKL